MRRISAVLAVQCLLAGLFLTELQAQEPVELCGGLQPTIVGTASNDLLIGTDGDDVIVGLGGHDRIRGLGGNDTICGNEGRDRINGGVGRDLLFGGTGQDFIRGGSGPDMILGGNARDRVFGGRANDEIRAGAGDDLVSGGPGLDLIETAGGADTVNGGDGEDICTDPDYDTTHSECEEHNFLVLTPYYLETFDVGGAMVTTYTATGQLPDVARRVQFNILTIDDGQGPEACLGAILTSDPPQCGGPRIEGLEYGPPWVRRYSPTLALGSRTIEVEWPLVNGALTLLEDRPLETNRGYREFPDLFPLPESCVGIDENLPQGVYGDWAAANPSQNGGIWIADRRIRVIQVKGDVDAARDAMTTDGIVPCVIQVDFNKQDIKITRRQVETALESLRHDPSIYWTSTGQGKDHIGVDLAVVDRTIVGKVLAGVDRPDLVEIESRGLLLP